jgi:hypothetical protein
MNGDADDHQRNYGTGRRPHISAELTEYEGLTHRRPGSQHLRLQVEGPI